MPTLAELRNAIGGGSDRDLVAARKAMIPILAAAEREKSDKAISVLREGLRQELTRELRPSENSQTVEIECLKQQNAALTQQLAAVRAELAQARVEMSAEAERFAGLSKHLLLETARMREQMMRPQFEAMPGLRFSPPRQPVELSDVTQCNDTDELYERN